MSRDNVPNVTIVVPVYGMFDLDSILATVPASPTGSAELVLIDNHETPLLSVDDTDCVRVVHEPTPGSYAARNAGAAVATGDVFAFTDADCIPHPDWLAEGVRVLMESPDRIVGGRVLTTTRPYPSAAEVYERRFSFHQQQYISDGFSVTANLFIRRVDFERLGGFDATLRSGGDREFGQRAVGLGFHIAYAPNAVVEHPARRTTRAILTKTRRVQSGAYEIARLRRGRVGVIKHVARRLPPPRDRVRAVLGDRGLGWRVRTQVAGICMLDYVVTLTTCLRRSLPGAPDPPRS